MPDADVLKLLFQGGSPALGILGALWLFRALDRRNSRNGKAPVQVCNSPPGLGEAVTRLTESIQRLNSLTEAQTSYMRDVIHEQLRDLKRARGLPERPGG